MHERFNKARRRLRGGAALCLSALLCLSGFTGMAQAAGVTNASLASAQTLVPVGHTVGIKLFARGVLVVKLPEGDTPARSCGLETGDVVLKCNAATVDSTEQFQELIQSSDGIPVTLQVRQGSALRTVTVTPEKNEQGKYSIGAWIRDSMAGIGTVTFYDPATGAFGALGHGITDIDTTQLMPFSSGSILSSTVKAVKRGEVGMAGELRGDFDLTGNLGDLYANTDNGIFGTLTDSASLPGAGDAVEVAENDEIVTGPATILTNVEGDEIQSYDVEITKLIPDAPDGRNLLIQVTDPKLLERTGGIVQGMSGSPILQNDKLVGAVTHVLLNDPTRGYGILIRHMLEEGDRQERENVS